MQQTTNLELNKFDSTDLLEATTRVGLNDNFDILDNAFSGITASIGTVEGEISTLQNTKAGKDEVATALSTKANIDGYYEPLTAGNALQLLSDISVTDKVPYLFRTAGGSLNIGNRETDKIVGGTVNFNQLVNPSENWAKSGGTATLSEADGVLSIEATSTDVSVAKYYRSESDFVSGHIYLSIGEIKSSVAGIACVWYNGSPFANMTTTTEWQKGAVIATPQVRGSAFTGVKVTTGANTGTIYLRNMAVFDLTAKLGSTIANYIYTLEQGTAGAGIAWAKKHFPFLDKYNPYNPGTLMSVKTSAHKTTGFNQWDEVWELGTYDSTTGLPVGSNYSIRGKNRIEVFPNTVYYANNNQVIRLYYDADDNFISYKYGIGTDTTPLNCRYMRICLSDVYGTTYNHDICINLHWDGERDGEYEPYVEHTYALDDVELRGIPKLDANNNLYYDGDTYESDGTVTRKYIEIDLSTLSWNKDTADLERFRSRQTAYNSASGWNGDWHNVISNCLIANNPDIAYSNRDFYSFANIKQNYYNFDIKAPTDRFADATAFMNWLADIDGNGTHAKIIIEVTTPTTETADEFANPQIVDDWGTEEYVDERTIPIPVGHETEYSLNLKAKLEMLPDSPNGNGLYGLKQTSGINSWELLAKELPSAPLTDGNYILKCTVSGGTPTLTWEEQV